MLYPKNVKMKRIGESRSSDKNLHTQTPECGVQRAPLLDILGLDPFFDLRVDRKKTTFAQARFSAA